MKTTIEIARIQLARLFYSPIAWLILILLLIQTSYNFTGIIDFYELQQRKNFPWPLLTRNIYTFPQGFRPGIFYALAQNLYLYLPLLTMGLLSAEISNGSIKLIYSSPILTRQLVFGKFLSMMIFSILMILCLWLFVIPGIFIIQDIDISLIVSASIGVFLLSSAYTAIGLFISSFSQYQIVVAIATFVILAGLNMIEDVGQEIAYLNEVTFWLSMPNRANDFISGLFKSQNLIYFLLIIIIFITFTILRLDFRRRASKWSIQVLTYSSVLAVASFCAVISTNPSWRWYKDFTQTDQNTISVNGQKILKELNDGPLQMRVFANILDQNVTSALPKFQNEDKRYFEGYQRFKPDLNFDYIYFYDTVENRSLYIENEDLSIEQLAEKMATLYGLDFDEVLSPVEIKKEVDLSSEGNQYIRQLSYDGNTTYLRMFDGIDHYPGEGNIIAAIKNLVEGSFLTVAFISEHDERSFKTNRDQDYTMAFSFKHQYKPSLKNDGMDFIDLALSENEIPDSVEILVLADPKTSLDSVELARIEKYIDDGGNMFIALEPNMDYTIRPILEKFGVKQISGQLYADNDEGYDRSLISANYNTQDTTLFPNAWLNEYILRYKYPVTMPSVSGWLYDSSFRDFIIKPFILAHNVESDRPGGSFSSIPTVLTISRLVSGIEQRIILSGDADFVSNKEITRRNITSINRRGLVSFMFHWLSNNQYPVDVNKPFGNDNHLNLSSKKGYTVSMLKIVYMGVASMVLFIIGGYILLKRRRR